MQVDRIQVLVQQAAAGNVEAFVALVQEFAPRLRLALGAHLDQSTALIPVELAVWSAVRSRLGEWLPEVPFSQWLQQMAMEPVATHLAQADRRAIAIQDALSHQVIEQCREALTTGSELQVIELPARLAGLPEAARTLLQRRYRERQRPAALAASLMISEPELATTLAIARAACDWREIAKPPGPGDRLVPPLIEDWLNGTIDVDSRALLATNLGRDHERATQFARQVRIHLALGAALAPFTREDAVMITRQTGLGAGDSGRVMMGEHQRPISGPRPPASDARRARMVISNRHVVPLGIDAPRPSPLPWVIGGGMVLVGIVALVAMSLGGGNRAPVPRPREPAPVSTVTPAATPASTTTPERVAPNSGGILRLDPGRTTTAPPPRISLVGPVTSSRAYVGYALDVRVDLSHTYGVTSVEIWNGNERVATLGQEPFVWTWDKPQAGIVSFTARALGPAGTLSTSTPVPVTVTQGYGTGNIRREWWNDIGGDLLAQGYLVAGYPDRPHGEDEVRNFATPRNTNDNYLQRVRGFIVPPVDGEYVFWIAGDDECELWLSEDDTRARLRRIAVSPMFSNGGTKPEEWERNPSQRSATIVLARGRRYYIEALHKEGTGDDHLEVGWRLPDGTLERPIPGAHLALPTEPVPAGAVVSSAPPPAAEPRAVPVPVTVLDVARRPDLLIWDGDGAKGGAGYRGFGSGGQSPLEVAPGQGRLGAGLRARLGGGNGANVGWNWHSWASDDAGTDLTGFAAVTLWVRFTGAAAPQKVVMRLSCSPREPVRRTVDIDLLARQPRLMDGAWHQVVVPLTELAPPGNLFDRAKVWEVSFDISSTANMDGSFDIDEIGALRSLIATPPALTPTMKVMRAINLGGETTEIDGVRFLGHRQAEAEGATPAGSHQPGPWLDELTWVRATNAYGEVKRNRNWSDKPLSIDGKVYAHGLGAHAASDLVYALDGRYSGFTAVVGIDDASEPGEAIFQVWVDGQKAFDSGVMRRGTAKPVAVPLAGRKELRLVVDPNGNNDWDHADWGNAQLLTPGGNDGVLQVHAGRRAVATFSPKPEVDAKWRGVLGTALAGTKEGLSFAVRVPNGPSTVWLWIGESGAGNSRQFDLTVEDVTLVGVGQLPANGWEKLGPIQVNVIDGKVDVAATVIKGIPQVMGIMVEQSPIAAALPDRQVVDDFERDAPDWSFVPGREFPGAKGMAVRDTGTAHNGTGAYRLDWDFTDGGGYVGMFKTFEKATAPEGITELRFWVKATGLTALGIRLTDSSGQWHQSSQRLSPTNEWQEMVVKIDQAVGGEHWGGAKDGRWHPPLKGFGLNVGKTKAAATGAFWIDDLTFVVAPTKP